MLAAVFQDISQGFRRPAHIAGKLQPLCAFHEYFLFPMIRQRTHRFCRTGQKLLQIHRFFLKHKHARVQPRQGEQGGNQSPDMLCLLFHPLKQLSSFFPLHLLLQKLLKQGNAGERRFQLMGNIRQVFRKFLSAFCRFLPAFPQFYHGLINLILQTGIFILCGTDSHIVFSAVDSCQVTGKFSDPLLSPLFIPPVTEKTGSAKQEEAKRKADGQAGKIMKCKQAGFISITFQKSGSRRFLFRQPAFKGLHHFSCAFRRCRHQQRRPGIKSGLTPPDRPKADYGAGQHTTAHPHNQGGNSRTFPIHFHPSCLSQACLRYCASQSFERDFQTCPPLYSQSLSPSV